MLLVSDRIWIIGQRELNRPGFTAASAGEIEHGRINPEMIGQFSDQALNCRLRIIRTGRSGHFAQQCLDLVFQRAAV